MKILKLRTVIPEKDFDLNGRKIFVAKEHYFELTIRGECNKTATLKLKKAAIKLFELGIKHRADSIADHNIDADGEAWAIELKKSFRTYRATAFRWSEKNQASAVRAHKKSARLGEVNTGSFRHKTPGRI